MASLSIKISSETKTALTEQRLHSDETFEQIINRLLKFQLENDDDHLDEQTLLDIQEGMDDIKAGRVHTTEQLKIQLGLK